MYLTGFADEAATALAGQIAATQSLGWKSIECRNIDGINIHDLDDPTFDRVCGQLEDAGLTVNCFGSTIANWSKDIRKAGDFERDLEQTRRAIPRMRRLGTRLVRIMSYAVIPQTPVWDQMASERFRRVREIAGMFLDAGIQPAHENCMNYGGMGWAFTLRLLENVPGLKLVFDTGNPVSAPDHTRSEPRSMQSSWEFYSHVRDAIAYIHVKDGRFDPATGKTRYTWPGEGDGDVARICRDLLARGYDGGISIEPHMGAVYHDPSIKTDEAARFAMYVEYGRRMEKLLKSLNKSASV